MGSDVQKKFSKITAEKISFTKTKDSKSKEKKQTVGPTQ